MTRYKEYKDYIHSEAWLSKRGEAFALKGRICERCGEKRKLVVHHKTYIRFKCENVEKDLAVLCEGCHNLYHQLHSHAGIRTTNDFIANKKEFSVRQIKRAKKTRRALEVKKGLFFSRKNRFIIKGKRVRFAKTPIHNPATVKVISLLEF